MISINLKDIQQICADIVGAVDSNELSALTETLELSVENQVLYLRVTNREYLAQVKLPLDQDFDFHATVNASLFLKLISQNTTKTIEFDVTDTSLLIKGNGNYNLPLIFDGDHLLELPKIEITNPTTSFTINTDILMSILNYNSKELLKGAPAKPVQKLYYVDEKGCITFTSGACVNNFTLPNNIKILLNSRLVKLFKLFKEPTVNFTLGYEAISEEIIQTRVKFETSSLEITAILSCDDTMINSVPVSAIRGRVNNLYPYSINVNKELLIQSINRLSLFNKDIIKPYSLFEFNSDSMTIFDTRKENKETVMYNNNCTITDTYTAYLDFNDLKLTLENCSDPYVTINFGDNTAIVIARGNVFNVIVECHE